MRWPLAFAVLSSFLAVELLWPQQITTMGLVEIFHPQTVGRDELVSHELAIAELQKTQAHAHHDRRLIAQITKTYAKLKASGHNERYAFMFYAMEALAKTSAEERALALDAWLSHQVPKLLNLPQGEARFAEDIRLLQDLIVTPAKATTLASWNKLKQQLTQAQIHRSIPARTTKVPVSWPQTILQFLILAVGLMMLNRPRKKEARKMAPMVVPEPISIAPTPLPVAPLRAKNEIDLLEKMDEALAQHGFIFQASAWRLAGQQSDSANLLVSISPDDLQTAFNHLYLGLVKLGQVTAARPTLSWGVHQQGERALMRFEIAGTEIKEELLRKDYEFFGADSFLGHVEKLELALASHSPQVMINYKDQVAVLEVSIERAPALNQDALQTRP